jgi:hypothetical protein
MNIDKYLDMDDNQLDNLLLGLDLNNKNIDKITYIANKSFTNKENYFLKKT